MDSKFFESGNYIYECKTSPGVRMGEYFNTSYLRSSINKLKARWSTGNVPSGYRYVFPVNYLDNEAVILVQNLQKDYPDVDIRYYDCDQVQKLIASLKKVGDMKSLVDYVEQARQ
jgi:hypothetical protein